MYGKEEAAQLRSLFWTSFGKYMGKHRSQSGVKVKWTNYKTGIKDVYFRLHCDKKMATVAIDLQHKDEGIRSLFQEQFQELNTVFQSIAGDFWEWQYHFDKSSNTECLRLAVCHAPVNLYNKDTWAETFHFFERHMLSLDEFWTEFSEIFKQLQD